MLCLGSRTPRGVPVHVVPRGGKSTARLPARFSMLLRHFHVYTFAMLQGLVCVPVGIVIVLYLLFLKFIGSRLTTGLIEVLLEHLHFWTIDLLQNVLRSVQFAQEGWWVFGTCLEPSWWWLINAETGKLLLTALCYKGRLLLVRGGWGPSVTTVHHRFAIILVLIQVWVWVYSKSLGVNHLFSYSTGVVFIVLVAAVNRWRRWVHNLSKLLFPNFPRRRLNW